jgi:asparagine synthase (glutamine-hydrolysing)
MLYTDLMTRVPDHNADDRATACPWPTRSRCARRCSTTAVVAFAGSLPASLKIRGRQLKVALRRVAERYLPADVVRRPKQGFGFPVGQWMRRELQPLVQSRLAHSRLVAAGVFRAEPIARLVDEHMSGRVDHSYRLWLLLNLDIWHSIYIEGDRVGDVQADVIRLTRSAA